MSLSESPPGQTVVDPETVPSVEYYKEQAIQCLKRSEYRDAALFLTRAIQQEKTPNPEIYCLRCRCYIKLKMLYLAYEDAEKAYMARPNNPDVVECLLWSKELHVLQVCFCSRLLFVTARSTWRQDATKWPWCSSVWPQRWIQWWRSLMNS